MKTSFKFLPTIFFLAAAAAFVAPATAFAQASCTPPPAGIVGWWKGEGNANDIGGTNNGSLSASGASYAAGEVGQGFRFDGTNGYVQIPDSDALKPTNVTVEAWVWLDPNRPAGQGNEQIVFKKNTWNAWFEGYSLSKSSIDNGNGTYTDHFHFVVSHTGNQVIINSQTIAQRGLWYHVAATYDGNQSVLYVNGVAEASATPGFALDYDTTPLFIGTTGTWAPYLDMFSGIIDEVSIYNRALGSNEIASIYLAGVAGKCTPGSTSCTPPPNGIVSWWPGENSTADLEGVNSGTWTGTGTLNSYGAGVVGHAFQFDGTHRDRVDVGNPANLQLQEFTIETWIKRTSTAVASLDENFADGSIAGPGGYIFGYGAGGYALVVQDDGTLALSQNSVNDTHVPPVITDTNWHHVAVTKSGGAVTFFVDGAQQPMPSLNSYTNVFQFTTSAAIGSRGDGGGNTFYGLVDEPAIYHHALSSNEVFAIYSAGSAGKCASTVVSAVPVIYNLAPSAGASGTTVVISGTNFNSLAANDVVRFGARQAVVLTASPTVLTAVVPVGAATGPLTVTVNRLTAYAGTPFVVTVPSFTSAVVAWGDNTFGQTNVPPGLTNVVAVAAGVCADHNLALKADGTLAAWGYNNVGQTTVPVGLSNVVAVAAGFGHNLVLRSDGTPAAWGYNSNVVTGTYSGQGTVPAGLSQALAVGAGWYHSLAVKTDGTVLAWGLDAQGQTNIPAGLSNVVAVAGAPCYSLALKVDGTVVAWGTNYNTPSGLSFQTMDAPAGLSNVVAVAPGYDFALALKADGTVVAWGDNYYGQINVPAGLANVVAIAAGTYHSLALKADGTVVTWGIPYPYVLNVPSGVTNVVGVAAGYYHNVALINSGFVPTPVVVSPPVISNLSPAIGTNRTAVTITGANFSAAASSNLVFFGAVRANVVSASTNGLLVTVPAGATFGPVTVTVGGLTAVSGQMFEPTFVGNGSNLATSSFAPSFNLPASGPGSIVIADLDGDGKPDLAFVDASSQSVTIYQNISTNGPPLSAASFAPRVDLPFPPGTGSHAYRLRAADLDGDGKLDLIACEVNSSNVTVFHNVSSPGLLSSNSFEAAFDLPVGNDCRFAAAADLDGDGRVDIVALNYGDKTISLLKNIGTAGTLNANSFAPAVVLAAPGGPYEVAIADLDGDGKPDLAVANSDDGTVSIYQNAGGALSNEIIPPRLDLPTGNTTATIAVADLDGDGKLDLIAGSVQSENISVFRNVSTGGPLTTNSFAPRVDFATGDWTHTVAIADFNGDGKPDIAVVGELPSTMSIFQNVSTPGSFTSASLAPRVDFGTGWNAWGVAAGDFDGDGRPDIVFCNYYDNTIQIYQNTMPFGAPTTICTPAPAGLVGWWKGEGTANDSAGGDNGTLSPSGATLCQR